MKRAQSDLIDAFLVNVREGLINGNPESSGPVVLDKIVTALEAIAGGADADEALGLSRHSGGPSDSKNAALAAFIHEYRKAGEKWATIEVLAEQWLNESGRESVSLPRLKQVYKSHFRALKQRDDIQRMIARCQGNQ